MPKFRTRPVDFEAEQFFSDGRLPLPFRDQGACCLGPDGVWYVVTAHGHQTPIVDGDWIRAEPDGRGFYPIKPDIFAERFAAVSSRHHTGDRNMSKNVYRYIVTPSSGRPGKIPFTAPAGARPLAVALIDDNVIMWAEIDLESPEEEQFVNVIRNADGEVPEGRYIGTVTMLGYAQDWHFYAICSPVREQP